MVEKKEDPHVKKIRRRIEDRLRKSGKEVILRIAQILGVKTD